jgi:tripartite-type tricarboxylate transporter receptor subunit TctC
MKTINKLAVAGVLGAAALAAQAQDFPNKLITLVNPYSAGGPADQVARAMARGLSDVLGQQVIVENKPGAGGGIAARYVAQSKPDGYTLLLANNASQVMAPYTTAASYDGVKDFSFLGMAANVSNLMVVHPSVKAKNLKEFIAYAKANPGKLSYASSGVGGSPHLAAEMFKQKAGVDMLHVPYKGAAPAVTDLVSGQVQAGIFNMSGVLQYVKAGKLNALAFASDKRTPHLPDVPTFEQAGLPDFEVQSWYAIAGPKGLPAPVADKLAKAIAKVHTTSEYQKTVNSQGAEVWQLTPEETTAFVKKDALATLDLIKSANLKIE